MAAIFGRARISADIVDRFKREILNETSIVPLHESSALASSVGAGPTVDRAIAISNKDPFYLSTIIQLSLLGWVHGRSSLASALIESMERRFELGVDGATPNPSYVGIVGTLEACNSQTSAIKWSDYLQAIESRIHRTCNSFQYQQDYMSGSVYRPRLYGLSLQGTKVARVTKNSYR